jgi:preprotein translocase subunit SecF
MSSTDKKQTTVLAVFSVLVIVMTLSPLGLNSNTNMAFAGGNHDNDQEGNSASQIIAQVQNSLQNSQVVSGDDIEDSGNNFNFQNQENSGNNAAAQRGGDDDGNNSNQGIGQDQRNEQNAQCVSGEDAIVSCNNVSFQNQVNSGFNVLGQD